MSDFYLQEKNLIVLMDGSIVYNGEPIKLNNYPYLISTKLQQAANRYWSSSSFNNRQIRIDLFDFMDASLHIICASCGKFCNQDCF